jgi:hypothetical protein
MLYNTLRIEPSIFKALKCYKLPYSCLLVQQLVVVVGAGRGRYWQCALYTCNHDTASHLLCVV